MAEVWRAHDLRLERPVAIKLLARHFTTEPEFLVRFFSEAQSIARIQHPNVVGVLDFGQHDERPYLVLEYVPGGAVPAIEGEPLLPERAVEIVADAAAGAGAAHRLGMVHRDIKPANILLCDDGRAKLADFGIASLTGSERLTGTGQAIGSPHYVSPEQATGRQCEPPSDVYSLGVVLYELIAGRKPFEGENATAIAISHVEKMPEPPSKLVGDLDPALDAIVMRCLAKDPSERFANGTELAEALRNPSAVRAIPAAAEDDDDSPWMVTDAPSALRRVGTVAAVIVGIVLLASVAVWSADRDDVDGPLSKDLETRDAGDPPTDERKKQGRDGDVELSGSEPAAFVPASSPSPSAAERERDNEETEPSPEPTEEPEPTPEPTEPEPTPEPTEEPEPTPEPTPTGL